MGEENILCGPEAKLPSDSFGKLVYESLKNGGDKIAMVDAISGHEITYNELLQRSVSIAQHLKQLGLTKNDTISICSENNLFFTLPALAAMYLGITVAPLNHFYVPRELVHAMNIFKPKLIFCAAKVLDNILKATEKINSVQKIIVFDIDSNIELPRSVEKFEQFVNLPLPTYFDITSVKPDHVVGILCSSGTTGQPKGVMLTHENFHAVLYQFRHPGFGALTSNKTAMALLPFYHAYGFVSHICELALHVKLVVLPKFEEILFLDAISKYKITVCFLVPPLIVFLAKHPLVDEYDISSLKEIFCGAAALGKDVQDMVIKRLKLQTLRQGYGLTETTLAVTLTPPNIDRSGSSGVLVPLTEGKVRDLETNKTLGPYKEGELCFRGAYIMKGYCGDVNSTAATIDKDGWLCTGDIGYYDQDGYFYIVDRLKELIKYKGFQVPPAELEAILLKHPEIKDCAVIGLPDESAGELPMAYVVKQPNATITEQEVISFVAENVSYHKRLHGGVKFVNEIPKSPTGKILRRILRDQLKSKL